MKFSYRFPASVTACAFLLLSACSSTGSSTSSNTEPAVSVSGDALLYSDETTPEAIAAVEESLGGDFRAPYSTSVSPESLVVAKRQSLSFALQGLEFVPVEPSEEDCVCEETLSTSECIEKLRRYCIESHPVEGQTPTDPADPSSPSPAPSSGEGDSGSSSGEEGGSGSSSGEGGSSPSDTPDPSTDGGSSEPDTPEPTPTPDDVDADGTPNGDDFDIDGDGTPNDQEDDGDLDRDGIPDESDDDMDGDGIPNGQDDDPAGPSSSSEGGDSGDGGVSGGGGSSGGDSNYPGAGSPSEGGGSGDPHLVTFDGVKYDSMAQGVFWNVKDVNANFEVQTIQDFMSGSTTLARTSGIAIKAFGHVAAFYQDVDVVTFDGSLVPLRSGQVLTWDGAILQRTDSGFLLATRERQYVEVESYSNAVDEPMLSVSIVLPRERNRYSGILGNADGNPLNEFVVDDGDRTIEEVATLGAVAMTNFALSGSTAYRLAADELYDEFISQFVVAQEESFFTDVAYREYRKPTSAITLNDFADDEIEAARDECAQATRLSRTHQSMFDCVYDHLVGEVAIEDMADVLFSGERHPNPIVWLDTE